jgi:transposase InsO family protein
MEQARRVIEAWRVEYNVERMHSPLGNLTPEEYAGQLSWRSSEGVSLPADCEFGRD